MATSNWVVGYRHALNLTPNQTHPKPSMSNDVSTPPAERTPAGRQLRYTDEPTPNYKITPHIADNCTPLPLHVTL